LSSVIYYDFYLREIFDSILLSALKVTLGIEFGRETQRTKKAFVN